MANRSDWMAVLENRLPRGAVQAIDDDSDFGGASLGPQVRVRTNTSDELRALLEIARHHAVPIAVRGAGHSSGGHISGRGGVVLEHSPAEHMSDVGDDVAEIPAHWTWSRAEAELRTQGRDLVVATSSLDTTVGGTLSVGGFGVRSVRSGPQVDQVRAIRLVLATGQLTWCSADDDSDLFHSALTGLGQVGIIDRVRISTRRRHDHVAALTAEHDCFSDLAEYLFSVGDGGAPQLDYCAAVAKQGKIESFVGTCHPTEPEARPRVDALASRAPASARGAVVPIERFEASERAMPLEHWSSCRNLWCDYCFDAVGFARFAAFVDAELGVSISDHLAYVMSIAPRRGVPLALDMRPPSDQQLYSLGLFYSVHRDDVAGVQRAFECHASALQTCLALGGRPYLYGLWGGAGGLSSPQLTAIYGGSYQRLCRVRERVDPLGIFNPHALNRT